MRPISAAAFAASCPASLASPAPACTCAVHQSGKRLDRQVGVGLGVKSDAPWRDFSASWASAVILLAAARRGSSSSVKHVNKIQTREESLRKEGRYSPAAAASVPSCAASQKLDMFFRRIMRVPQLASEIACVPAVPKPTHDYSSEEQDERA